MNAIGPAGFSGPQWIAGAVSPPALSDPDSLRTPQAAARGLEATFLTELVKEMRQTLGPETMFGKDGGDVYGGLFDQFLAQHIVQGGGVGLAREIERQLGPAHSHDPSRATPAAGQPGPGL